MTHKGYFDIDIILLGEEKVPITTSKTLKKLGWLNESKNEDVPEGTEMLIPFWMALEFHHSKYGKVEKLPKILDKSHLKEIDATDFDVGDDTYKEINLNKMSNYYFDLGITYMSQFQDDETVDHIFKDSLSELGKSLSEAFKKRFNTCLLQSFFSTKSVEENYENTRTIIEYDLFVKGRESCFEFDQWEKLGFDSRKSTRKRNRPYINDKPRKKVRT